MIHSEIYRKDVEEAATSLLPWEKLENKKLLVTGASGMIGSFLIDVLMCRNRLFKSHIEVCAVTRSEISARKRFQDYMAHQELTFLEWDVTTPFPRQRRKKWDYIIHGASNTHPLAYSSDPVGTIKGNVSGLLELMDLSCLIKPSRLLLLSSVEIYGENRGDRERYREEDLGYLDCNTVRAGYPESKRLSESICQAYASQYGLHSLIIRLSRVYGPTLRPEDSKALSQFIRRAVEGEDIVLKSEGKQYYSYTYVADAVTAILWILLAGEDQVAYNVADPASDVTLKSLAEILARRAGSKVIFERPDALEAAGYSKATKALLDSSRLKELGWQASYDIERGLEHTLAILKEGGYQ